uniref:BTB domain-containing protein n=1 Tax=Panagrolaimus sp. PS1159 TaxID=55785 RepID=A0AC35F558_9BILA
MATNINCFFLNDNPESVTAYNFQTVHDNQYSNLNLNQNLKCLDVFPIQSNSKSYKNKNCVSDNIERRENLLHLNKPSKIFNFSNFINDKTENEEFKKPWKTNSYSNTTNKSTLSLHIAAYENSVETDSFNGSKNKDWQKGKSDSIRNEKQIFTAGTFVIQNSFEFARQRNESSQRLFNPNEATKNAAIMNSQLNYYSAQMGNDQYQIFKAQQFVDGLFDVIFNVAGKKVYAHRLILGSASTTFQSMFSDRWNPDKKVIHTINIHEYSYEIFYGFVRYLYTGTDITLNDENLFKYAELAEYYNVVPLQEYCFTYLRLAEYDAAHFVDFAEHFFDHPTYSQAFQSGLMKQYPKWLDTPKFLYAGKELVSAILDSDRPYKHEEHLFRIVYKWARKNAENLHEEYVYHFMNIDDDDCQIIEDSGLRCKSTSSSPIYKLDDGSDDEMNVVSNDGKPNPKLVDSNEGVLVTKNDTVVIHDTDECNINDVSIISESDEGLLTDTDEEMDIDINGGKNNNTNTGKLGDSNKSVLLTKYYNGVVPDKGSIRGIDSNGGKTNRKLGDSNKSVHLTNKDVVIRDSIKAKIRDTDYGVISESDDGMLPDTDEEEDDCVILDEINPRKPKIPTFDELLLNELRDLLPKFHFYAMGKEFISSF